MKRYFVATVVALLLSAPLTFSNVRPLPDSKAWEGYSESMNDDQRYFARNF